MDAIPSVLLASVLWAAATQFYSYLGKEITVRRLNLYKSVVSFVFFFAVCSFQRSLIPPDGTLIFLLCSGILGFALGDLLIFYSFSQMGSARTLMISAFGPAILGLQSFLFLGLELNWLHGVGILLMFVCVFFISLDKMEGINFNWKLVGIALVGFFLDGAGIILSKKAFIISSELGSSMANMYRIFVAIIFLGIMNFVQGVKIGISDLDRKLIFYVILSSFIGTFLALLLWLNAISKGHPAVMAALGALCPVYSACYEYFKLRRWPSPSFFMALATMGLGVYVLIHAGA